MLLCSCRAVTERTIRAAIASGARSPEEIANRCGAGSKCGGCWPALFALLEESGAGRGERRGHAHPAA